jgi:hypothetical protein
VAARKGGLGMEEEMSLVHSEKKDRKAIPWDKLIGVALLGAIGSAALYYIFLQLEDEKKEYYKDTVVRFGKSWLAKQFQGESDEI